MLDKAHELIDFTDYHDLFNKYETLKKISFDYAVVENESKIQVMRFAGQWKDMGTWNTLTEAMEEPSIGKAILNDTCEGVNVLNELDVPVLCMGLKNVVVSASPGGHPRLRQGTIQLHQALCGQHSPANYVCRKVLGFLPRVGH